LVSWSGPRCPWGSGGDESLSGIMRLLCRVGGSGRCPDPVRWNAFGVTGVAQERFRGRRFLSRRMLVSWSGPRHPRDAGRASARCTRSEDMPEACPYNNYFDSDRFPLRVLRATSWTKTRRTGVGRNRWCWMVHLRCVRRPERCPAVQGQVLPAVWATPKRSGAWRPPTALRSA
jgi:hypothetical protein